MELPTIDPSIMFFYCYYYCAFSHSHNNSHGGGGVRLGGSYCRINRANINKSTYFSSWITKVFIFHYGKLKI